MAFHEESWDDDDLLNDWNAAHTEYMRYHSIAAQEKAARDTGLNEDVTANSGTTAQVHLDQGPEQHTSPSSPLDPRANAKAEVAIENDEASNAAPSQIPEATDISKARELARTSQWWRGYCHGFEAGKLQAAQETIAKEEAQR